MWCSRGAEVGCTGLHWAALVTLLCCSAWLHGAAQGVRRGGSGRESCDQGCQGMALHRRTHLPYATSVRASSGREMRAAVAWCSRYACPGAGDGEAQNR